MVNIAIFASGQGTNAENLINFFRDSPFGKVVLVVSNKADAPVLNKAKDAGVDTYTIAPGKSSEQELLQILKTEKIDFIVLAGYLKLIPSAIIENYKNKIVNIHPALLPLFGGKGMYGMKVHEAVIDAGVNETGITIHYVNDIYDDGEIIFQAKVEVIPGDSSTDVMQKVRTLEHKHFPVEVEKLIRK
jgi:phosphoribosylglycinamide formyltransferase 1